MHECLSVPVELRKQGAHLHVCLAFVFEALQAALGVHIFKVWRVKCLDAGLKTQRTFLEGAQLLEAEGHVVHRKVDH